MRITRYLGRKLKFLVDFPAWMSWGEIKTHTGNMKHIVVDTFKRDQAPPRSERFEDAVQRLGLSEADLERRAKLFLGTSLFYLTIGILLFAYTVFLSLKHGLASALVALAVTALAMSLAFRESFFRFQIKQRKLGCTVREWLGQFTIR